MQSPVARLTMPMSAWSLANWVAVARQLTEACGWERTPDYLVRDHDAVYGEIVTRRLRAMGIRDRPIAPRSPWQNGHAERLIGSLRRECLDYVVVFGERHLRHVLLMYLDYQREDTPVLEQGCARTTGYSDRWAHLRKPNSRRITPSVCPDLIYDRDRLECSWQATASRPRGQWRVPQSGETPQGSADRRLIFLRRKEWTSAPKRASLSPCGVRPLALSGILPRWR